MTSRASVVVTESSGRGGQSDANSTWRDARFHSDVLNWPCKSECRGETRVRESIWLLLAYA